MSLSSFLLPTLPSILLEKLSMLGHIQFTITRLKIVMIPGHLPILDPSEFLVKENINITKEKASNILA